MTHLKHFDMSKWVIAFTGHLVRRSPGTAQRIPGNSSIDKAASVSLAHTGCLDRTMSAGNWESSARVPKRLH